MADSNGNMTHDDVIDWFLGRNTNTSRTTTRANTSASTEAMIRSIQQDVRKISVSIANGSASAARDRVRSGFHDEDRGYFGRAYDDYTRTPSGEKRKKSPGGYGSFTDELEESLLQGLFGADISGDIGKVLSDFGQQIADTMGVKLEDVKGALGRELGSQLSNAIKNTKLGSAISAKITDFKDQAASKLGDYLKNNFEKGVEQYAKTGKIFGKGTDWTKNAAADGAARAAEAATSSAVDSTVTSAVGDATSYAASTAATEAGAAAAGTAATAAGTSAAAGGAAAGGAAAAGTAAAGTAAAGASSALAGLAGVIGPLLPALAAALPYVLAAGAALAVLSVVTGDLQKSFKKLKAGWDSLKKSMSEAGNRYENSREKNLELANKRYEADIEEMISAPFKILEDAATSVQEAWDETLRVINGTQGYTKSDLQDLMSVYSQRLRDEGLSKVVSAADLTQNLQKVLDSGMSGKVAEEFSYLATKLNAAIPNQDFFSYADSYIQLAANRIKAGDSETDAINYASKQLEMFASNILYANRQLAGGFTTGLKEANTIFESAVKISETSKVGDASEIAGVLTSIAATTGGIAPDLATSMVDAVVQAATGGNSPELVALRSLAGVNAGNTEFLRQLASNPKKLFADLFSNLSKMQNMSNDNFMEVAEGLSSVFGVSMDAFARIDFAYLADSISRMQVNNSSLSENMRLLQSGETTLNKDQLRYQQINQYMIDEGLAYVLDNEVARAVQQHMWEEQLAREIMEAEYAVNLRGSALEFLEGIRSTVRSIMNFLNPFAWISKIVNVVATAKQSYDQDDDLKQLLELGKVGQGNAKALQQLITRNEKLDLIPDMLKLMGGHSAYQASRAALDYYNENLTGLWGFNGAIVSLARDGTVQGRALSALTTALENSMGDKSSGISGPNSAYKWGTVGKTSAAAVQAMFGNSPSFSATNLSSPLPPSQVPSGTSAAQASVNERLKQALSSEYMKPFMDRDNGGGYEAYVASVKSDFGVTDFDEFLKNAGYTEEQVRNAFEESAANYGAEEQWKRYQREEHYWERQNLYADNMERDMTSLLNLTEMTNQKLTDIYERLGLFHADALSYQTEWLMNGDASAWSRFTSEMKAFRDTWVSYFIDHSAYNDAYRYTKEDWNSLIHAEDQEKGEAIYKLAEALTVGVQDLSDPQVQANSLLGQILIVLNAIAQQNNQASGGLSLIDTLSGLALGGTVQSG